MTIIIFRILKKFFLKIYFSVHGNFRFRWRNINRMASVIDFEVSVDDEDKDKDNEVSDDSDAESLLFFTDDNVQTNNANFYQSFDNVEADIGETLAKEYEKGLQEIDNLDDISNLRETSEEENEIDDFKISEQRVDNFKETIFSKTKENEEPNSFISTILHAISFQKEEKTDICNKGDLKEIIDENLINQLDKGKYEFTLDLQKFNNNCYEINCFLSSYNLFMRVFELRSKFRYLTLKEFKKQSIVRQLSSCITEKYNGIQTIAIEFARKTRKNFKPSNIYL